MILFPNAKINIGLNIIKKRSDGYHEIETLMYPIGLTDILELNKPAQPNPEKIKLTTSGLVIDSDAENNLIVKAYRLLDIDYSLPPVNVHLHKVIPFGAGLGGGSADGAFMLKALNNYFSLDINYNRLEYYAAKLGSDCPFFIENMPAIATGRGEQLSKHEIDLANYYIAIVKPPVAISTAQAYSGVLPQQPKHKLTDCLSTAINSWKNILNNDFEPSVFKIAPEIKNVKDKLIDKGALYASMSGSGSAVYGVFNNKPNLQNMFTNDYFVWVSDKL